MNCIKRVSFLTVLMASLGLILAGCESTGGKKEKVGEPVVDEKGNAVEEPFVKLPNPYEQSKKSVPSQAKVEFARVKQSMQDKKWQEAEDLLTLMIETFPKLSGPYVNLGIVHAKQDEMEEAEEAFKFAIKTNKYNFDAYNQLGFLYREQGRFDEAETTYLSALTLWPHHLASNKNIGILYDLYMGRFDEALKYYELAQKINEQEDRQLKGWIIDLKRRMAKRK